MTALITLITLTYRIFSMIHIDIIYVLPAKSFKSRLFLFCEHDFRPRKPSQEREPTKILKFNLLIFALWPLRPLWRKKKKPLKLHLTYQARNWKYSVGNLFYFSIMTIMPDNDWHFISLYLPCCKLTASLPWEVSVLQALNKPQTNNNICRDHYMLGVGIRPLHHL